MKIDTGKLNKRITLLTSRYTDGEQDTKQVTVWAEEKSVNRAEFYTSYQSGLRPQVVFRLRKNAYKLSLVTDSDNSKRYADRVTYDGTTYDIIRDFIEDEAVEIVCG